jgi:reactive intermediate/imine deaminase
MEGSRVKEIIRPKNFPEPKAPFSYGILTEPQKVLFIAGQTPINEKGQIVGINDFEAQAKQVFENMKAVVEAAGGSFANIVKVTIYITDVKHRQALDRVRSAYYGATPPTSTLVVVAGLAQTEYLLEVESIAVF